MAEIYGLATQSWNFFAVTPDVKEHPVETFSDIEVQSVREKLIALQKQLYTDVVSFIHEGDTDLFTVFISPRPVEGVIRYAYERRKVDLLKILSDLGKCSVTHENAYEFISSPKMKLVLSRTGPTDASLIFQYDPDDGLARSSTILVGHAVLDVNRVRFLNSEKIYIDTIACTFRTLKSAPERALQSEKKT